MLGLTALSYAVSLAAQPSFSSWLVTNGRNYTSFEEFTHRENVYNQNLHKIAAHNSQGNSWTMGANKFADLTPREFKQLTGSCVFPERNRHNNLRIDIGAPSSVDWTTKGAVTPVKNQGQCGSCWSFSATGSMEGAWFLSNGTLPSLSEQQLVDCSGAQGNQGCNGGLMDSAFQYVIANGGITSESNYPYTATDGTCNAAKAKQVVATISSFTDVPAGSESALMAAVAQQPVSVAVEADQSVFQLYAGGVMTSPCGTNLDHGVLVVGYGTQNGLDYWKVKNSWGSSWGMDGYILLGRGSQYGANGQCGVQMDPSYPVVA